MIDMNMVEVRLGGMRIGKLTLTPDRLCAFQYDSEYLADGISVSPFELPLTPELFVAKRLPFDGNFGVFDDSLPDGWGRLVLDRYLREKGEDPMRINALQLLSAAGSNGRGALEYKPETTAVEYSSDIGSFSFDSFQNAASEIFRTGETEKLPADILFKYSGSSGGARPKLFLKDNNGREWLVKFQASTDEPEIGQIEYEYSLLAKRCGIAMPDTRLFESKYFGTERFDRTPTGKIHVISAAALLGADYRSPSLDYISLLKACSILTRDIREVEALYRLMVFNVVIENRDDHAKNFVFILDDEAWKFAPAFDLLPSRGFGGFHTTTVNGSGTPEPGDMLAAALATGITAKRAKDIIDEVTTICAENRPASI